MDWPFSSKKNTPDVIHGGYILIGPQDSGKTVLFATIIELLLAKNNTDKLNGFKLRDIENKCNTADDIFKTREQRDEIIKKLKNGKFPDNSVNPARYMVELRRKGWIFDDKRTLKLFDYPGESYLKAFGSSQPLDKIHQKNALTLRMEVEAAAGIFVTIDSRRLYNSLSGNSFDDTKTGLSDIELNCLWRIAKIMENKNWIFPDHRKLGIIFTKADMLPENFDPWESLKTFNKDFFKDIKDIKCKHFKCSILDQYYDVRDGKRYPKKGWNPESTERTILSPIYWMLGLENEKGK